MRRKPILVWGGIVGISAPLLWLFITINGPLDKGDFGPFVRSLNTTEHGYQIIPDPTGTAPAARVERFEVRAGDCGQNGAWSDCAQDRERSELSERSGAVGAGGTYWYGFSFYLDADFPNVWPTKTVIAQFHQTGLHGTNGHPVWMLLHGPQGLVLDDQTTGRSSRKIQLLTEGDLRGRWHQIEVRAHWARGDTGRFDLWLNGEQVFGHQGATMNNLAVYFRYGVYRSFVSRYQAIKDVKAVPTQVAYFANVKRAETRDGLR